MVANTDAQALTTSRAERISQMGVSPPVWVAANRFLTGVTQVARELGILTFGVATKPFQFEGQHRMRLAEAGFSRKA